MTRSKTILVVDAEDAVRRLIRDVLAPEGYDLLEAGSVEEAFEVADRHEGPIDLVVTDMDMPFVNGFAFSRGLRRRRVGIRILFLSGLTGDLLHRHGFREDAPNFLPKPFDTREMVAKTAALFEN